MEGESPDKKLKIKKAKLRKTVGGKISKKEAILNRMSSGKRRPRSEPRVRKERDISPSTDFLVKKLAFDDNSDDEHDAVPEKKKAPSLVKQKKKKELVLKMPTPKKMSKVKPGSASSWQVTDTKYGVEKLGGGSITKIVKKSGNVMTKTTIKKYGSRKEEGDDTEEKLAFGKHFDSDLDSDDNEDDDDIDDNDDGDEDVDDDDDEIDFPVLKRKSLGPERKISEENQIVITGTKIQMKAEKTKKEKKESDKDKREKRESSHESQAQEEQRSDGQKSAEKRKKKNKKRGKKRKLSNSESDVQAKKNRVDEFAVRCGNLPVGTSKTDLNMFLGEADIFPKSINIKTKKIKSPGEKKSAIKYATLVCTSEEEVKRLCSLNGISMPSSVGNKERRLLIHRINADVSNDPDLIFLRKLFVRNLHPKVTEDELFEFLEEKKLHPTNVIFPRRKEKQKFGTALVWLRTSGDVDRAVKVKNPTLRDQECIIARSNVSTRKELDPSESDP